MKTNIKIEIGILVLASLFGIILQSYMNNSMTVNKEEIEELSGTFSEKSYPIESFSELVISTKFPVEFKIGEPKVIIKTDESLFDEQNVKIDENSLSIEDKSNNFRPSENVRSASLITIYNDIDLSKIAIYSGTKLNLIDSIQTDNLEIFADGGASTNGKVHVNSINVRSNGGSTINLSGSSNTSTISSNGGAQIYMKNHKSTSSKVSANGGGYSAIYVIEEVEAHANGGARIKLFGTPKSVDTNSDGGGNISRNFDK